MCGIVGWVSFTEDLCSKRGQLEKMVDTLRLRGPDASGLWMSKTAAFGHTRLAVVDINGGQQPMLDVRSGGEIVVSFSGEIYNYRELRSQLQDFGHVFQTASDTEVLLKSYIQWGDDAFERFNGMYAFAVWDARIQSLLLVRDRLGVKPLYFADTQHGILFASEPKALFASAVVPKIVNADGLREALSWARGTDATVWRDIKEVEPGCFRTYSRGSHKVHRYWSLRPLSHKDNHAVTVERVRSYLYDSVGLQVSADVPLCTLLSGGLDSSAITAITAKLAGESQVNRSFSVDFSTIPGAFVKDRFRDDSDGPYASLAAKHIGTKHTSLSFDGRAIGDPNVRRAVIAAKDSPTGFGNADNSLYLLFAAIREEATVALSGESADEVFGGYKWLHQPNIVESATLPWIEHTHVTSPNTGSSLFRDEVLAALALPAHAREAYDRSISQVPRVDEESPFDARMREICYLHLTQYLRILLDRKDRLSMAVGLEVRVPFCDHRLVEYVFNTPWSMKTADGREKSLLRAAVGDILPEAILLRRKAPYPATADLSYKSQILAQAAELACDHDHAVFDLVDQARLETVSRADPGTLNSSDEVGIERVLNFATWFDLYNPEIESL